jgi:hypothetical protein
MRFLTRISHFIKQNAAWLTLALVVIGFLSFIFIQLPSESRERAVATSNALSLRPGVQIFFYVASNPLLDGEDDIEKLTQAGLSTRVVRTPYQLALSRISPASEDIGFLFLLVANKGPGIASSIEIVGLDWIPRGNATPPSGLLEDTNYGPLNPGEAYALLVDASDGLSDLYFDASNAQDICVKLSFTDIQDSTYDYQGRRCMSQLEGQPPYLNP